MLITCPNCKTRFRFDEQRIRSEAIKLRCSKCRALFRALRKPAEPTVETAVGSGRLKVLVANESAAFCQAVRSVLALEPFDVFAYHDGRAALTAIEQIRPEVVLLDVALPSMFGFEVCEAIRRNPGLNGVKIILLAAIYDKTRYKRTPQSLYGADDYIEKHHIPDTLVPMINRLVGGQQSLEEPMAAAADAAAAEEEALPAPLAEPVQEAVAEATAREVLRQEEELATIPPPLPPELAEAHRKAQRLARIIISDIALYNQARVEEGIRTGTLNAVLADDIQEGRALYERRVPAEVRLGTTYLDAALAELIAKKRQELNLAPVSGASGFASPPAEGVGRGQYA